MSLRLSIIIPFYNVEPYIGQCLDSVFDQDVPEDDYEVICVNDASPDHSRDIVLDYQKKHPNIVLVEHEVNKKLGTARNTGRKIARGKYIWNVDSDDMIAPNCLGGILDVCEKNELDVLLFGFKRLREGDLQDKEIEPWTENDYVFTGLSFWKQQGMHNQAEISQVWTQVYRKAYLDENGIYSPEVNMSEDVPYTYASILMAKRMIACNRPYYIYRDNPASLSAVIKNTPTPDSLYENCFGCGKLLFDLLQLVSPTDGDIRQSIINVSRTVVLEHQDFFQRMDTASQREFVCLCRREFFRSLYLFRLLNGRQLYQYCKFLVSGKL